MLNHNHSLYVLACGKVCAINTDMGFTVGSYMFNCFLSVCSKIIIACIFWTGFSNALEFVAACHQLEWKLPLKWQVLSLQMPNSTSAPSSKQQYIKKLNYLGVVLKCDKRQNNGIDTLIGGWTKRLIHRWQSKHSITCVLPFRGQTMWAFRNLSVFKATFVAILTYGHEF